MKNAPCIYRQGGEETKAETILSETTDNTVDQQGRYWSLGLVYPQDLISGTKALGTMNIDQQWYTSGTFWAAAGVVVALFVGITATLATYRVSFPKRRLLYGMPIVAPLGSAHTSVENELELRYRGIALTEPHLLELRLISRSRKDIPSSAYDGGDPIRLDAAVRVIDVISVASGPESVPVPQFSIDGTSLEIGPSYIGKRQQIIFTVLADGSNPSLTCKSRLIDVDIRRLRPEDLRPIATAVPGIISAIVTAGAVLGILWALAVASAARAAVSAAKTAYWGALNSARATTVEEELIRAGGKLTPGPTPSLALLKTQFSIYSSQQQAALDAEVTERGIASNYTHAAAGFVILAVICCFITALILWRRWLRAKASRV